MDTTNDQAPIDLDFEPESDVWENFNTLGENHWTVRPASIEDLVRTGRSLTVEL